MLIPLHPPILGLSVLVCLAAVLACAGILRWQMDNLRRARKGIRAASATNSEFLATVSSEIRTPVNGIAGMADQLVHTNLDAGQREMAGLIQSSAHSLMASVNDILDYSRMEAEGYQTEDSDFDLRSVVESCIERAEPRAIEKGLRFEREISAVLPRKVRGDPEGLRKILLHLLDNAVKFTGTGKVRLEALPGGEVSPCRAVLFRVIDTGIGMHPSSLPSGVYKYRAGLGLAMSRRLISLMGGSMGMDSQPGEGTTLWFLFPVAPVPDKGAPTALLPDEGSGKGSVLIVDGNPVNQIVTLRAVRGLGYAAEVVSGGEEALRAIDGSGFDAVLIDCTIAGLDGYALASEIRRREGIANSGGRVPIVAMTGGEGGEDPERLIAAGIDDYLLKPVQLGGLATALERWTGVTAASANLLPASPRSRGQPSDR